MGAGKILETNNWMMGIMTHNIQLTREKKRQAILLTGGGVTKDPVRSRHAQEEEGKMTPTLPLSYNQTSCMHPPPVECYAIQAFSIASNFDHKEQNQMMMRKVCTVIKFLLSRRLNPHSSYS